jgi:predicted aspartyl protease
MRKTFYTAGRLLLAVSILGASALALNHDAAGIARAAGAPLPEGHPKIDKHGSAAPAAPKFDFSKIVKPKGGKTVQEVYQEKIKLNGKRVTLRGKVVKYNEAIMGKNWLHLRDGTGKDPTNDLTVTTQAKTKVGDTVLVEGAVTLDKDLGAGYKYDVMIEDAKVKIE